MKVEIENLQGHHKKLTIEIPADHVTAHLEDHFRDIQKNVELKGFRKGKAPLEMIKKLYADSAANRVTQEIVEDHLRQALTEHSLSPITMPQVDAPVLMHNVPFKFTATFEASPPVELSDYTSLKLQRPAVTVAEDEITNTIQNIQDQVAKFEAVPEGTTADKNLVAQLDYEATEAGKAVPEATENGATVELGSGTLTPDFEKNIFGMKIGDKKNFSVKFPMPDKEEEKTPVSGRTLDFSVTLKDLRSKVRPELTDDFAKSVGPFQGLADLKARIEEDLKKQKDTNNTRELQEKAIDWLLEKNKLEAPETLVNQQMEQLAIDAGMQLSQMGLDEKAIEERLKNWGDQMLERATRQIKISMLLGAISKKESIQANDDDVREEITRIAVQSKRNPKDVLEDLQKRGLVGGLVRQVTEMKTLNWVLHKATA